MKLLSTYVVEDNAVILEHLIEALEEVAEAKVVGHSATEAEASRWLHAHSGEWQLAIVDLFLQEGNGLTLLAECRDRKPHQKVVLLTNYATPDIRRRAVALRADAVFDKSTELDNLIEYCLVLTTELRQRVN